MNKATQDQIAAVMLLHGTPAQQAEVVAHISQQQVSYKRTMNKRIIELAREAGLKVYSDMPREIDRAFFASVDEPINKFAELLIAECLNTVGHYANVDEGIAVAKRNLGVDS
jgi:hypothetical protein